MPASEETATERAAQQRAHPEVLGLADRLLVLGELALAQLLGVPSTRASCEYLAGRWRPYLRRRTNRPRSVNAKSEVAPPAAIAACDPERS